MAQVDRNQNPFLKRSSEPELAFGKPWSTKFFAGLVVVVMLILSSPLYFVGTPDPSTLSNKIGCDVLSGMVLSMGVLTLYFTGPQDICFDLRRRTYYVTRGWPIRPNVLRGSVDDLSGVFIAWRRDNWFVLIAWKSSVKSPPLFGRPVLGMFPRQADALALAQKTASALGLAVIDDPKPWTR